MRTIIVGEQAAGTVNLCRALAELGIACLSENIFPFATAAHQLRVCDHPDLLLVVTGESPEVAHSLLKDIRNELQCKIIVIGPRDPSWILATMRLEVDDYLDDATDLALQLAPSLKRFVESHHTTKPRGETIAVLSASGGCGGTVLATNLAVAIAAEETTCGLVGMDARTAKVASQLNAKPRHSLADLCRSRDKLDRKMLEQSLHAHDCGVKLLDAPHSFDDAADIDPQAVTDIVKLCREVTPFVVADVGDARLPGKRSFITECEAVLLVFRLDFPCVENLKVTIDSLERRGFDLDRLRLVANRYGQAKQLTPAKVEAAIGRKILHLIPDETQIVNQCVNCGTPPVLEFPQSKFAVAVKELATVVRSHGRQPPIPGPHGDREKRATKFSWKSIVASYF